MEQGMFELPFSTWLATYIEFRTRAATVLKVPLGSEVAVLQRDSQELEPLLWEAEEFRAMAEGYYYKAKVKGTDTLIAGGWARGSAFEVSKARAYKELWARENSRGLCRVIESRAFKCAQHLKLLDGK